MNARISKRKAVLGIAVLLVVLVCVALFLSSGGYPREVTLTGGHKLRLERVNFGGLEPFKPGGWLQRMGQAVAPHLPKKWATEIVAPRTSNRASWFNNFFLSHTNEPALHIWLTRVDPRTGRFQDVAVESAEIVDADGCAFGCTTAGGFDDGLLTPIMPVVALGGTMVRRVISRPRNSSVVIFRFEVFPRHEKRFKLRLFDATHDLMAEYVIGNPTPVAPWPRWQPQSLPMSATNGDAVFKLTAAKPASQTPELVTGSVSYRMPREVLYEFDYSRAGLALTRWDPVAMELRDSSGNIAPKWGNHPFALCPSEPAWKLRVSFAGDEPSNWLWTLTNLPVPAPGTILKLDSNTVLDGISIRVIGMGGAGLTVYSNGVAVSSQSSMALTMQTLRGSGPAFRNFSSGDPHLAVVLGEIRDDQRISVYATDEQGRRFYLSDGSGSSIDGPVTHYGERAPPNSVQYIGPNTRGGTTAQVNMNIKFLMLEAPKDCKIVDLTFCVHRTRTVDFIFKPPPWPLYGKAN